MSYREFPEAEVTPGVCDKIDEKMKASQSRVR